MDVGLNKREILVKLITSMSDSDTQQMLAYAAGYEAGKISQISSNVSDQPRKPPKQTA